MANYITADLHIGDANVAKLWGFSCVDELNAYMLSIWNRDVVGGTVWVLGDFITSIRYVDIIDKMAGEIRLVRGNHESRGVIAALNKHPRVKVFGWVKLIMVGGRKVVLTHKYAENNCLVLHGHSHGMGKGDVGIMTWDRILRLEDVVRKLRDEKMS